MTGTEHNGPYENNNRAKLTVILFYIVSQDNALQAEAETIDDYSANIELSDLDNDQSSDSQQSESSHDESGETPSHSDKVCKFKYLYSYRTSVHSKAMFLF